MPPNNDNFGIHETSSPTEVTEEGEYVTREVAAYASRRDEIELNIRDTISKFLTASIVERKAYAKKVYTLVIWWLLAIAALIVTQGFCPSFDLDTPVLVTIVGGTTASVIGIFSIVVTSIFSLKDVAKMISDGKHEK